MSEEGEKTCPLCAEEMDLTDQQLKPCKCGYDICVWCWHHIMDMAEKDETEGRCPACRAPYNKEKIVGTTASCGRLLAEVGVEKKLKSQKGKSKPSEGRKQLASVRVIQRNLVYVVGLPLSCADEDLLQRREYFGQYGKVLKVSISRTAAGAIQQFANTTCSVYITYMEEEEAVRCIQSVHGFALDGRPLRACFGTTKYCHAWLRNVPCSNPDCLYLHEVGSQEDSFTKDEIISAYTRVQQITGSSNSMQRRSGDVLPPPADEYLNNSSTSSGNPTIKIAVNTHNSTIGAKVSPPNSSSGRSAALPSGAAWGSRASSSQPSVTSTPNSNGPFKQKLGVCNGPATCSTAVASPSQVLSLQTDTGKLSVSGVENTISQDKTKIETLVAEKKESNTEQRTAFSESSSASVHPVTLLTNRLPHDPPPNITNGVDSSLMTSEPASDIDSIGARDAIIENIRSDILSMSTHENRHLQNGYVVQTSEPLNSHIPENASKTTVHATNIQSDHRLGMQTQLKETDLHEMEDSLSFHEQRLKDPEVTVSRIHDLSHAFHQSRDSNFHSSQFNTTDGSTTVGVDRQVVDINVNLILPNSNIPGGHPENILNGPKANDFGYSNFLPSKEKRSLPGRYNDEGASSGFDMWESSIISNILSMDLDPWDESVTSPQNLAKLLGDTDKQPGSSGVPGSQKVQNNNQSRFSFAREEPTSQVSNFSRSVDHLQQGFKQHLLGHESSNRNGLRLEKFLTHNHLPLLNATESEIFASGHSHIFSNNLPMSRSQKSAPPGFPAANRAPPPGFTSHERAEQILGSLSGNHIPDASSLLRNQYQIPPGGNTINNGDIEFIDPAILAVGKGTLAGGINSPGILDMRTSFASQLDAYEEARFQSLFQRSLPPHQNQRFSNPGDSFSSLSDAYGIPSRVMEQTLATNVSAFSYGIPSSNSMTSNAQWDGWNEVQGGNNLGMAELFRNERLGLNKFYGGYEDSKIRMPSSGNVYNGTYGI